MVMSGKNEAPAGGASGTPSPQGVSTQQGLKISRSYMKWKVDIGPRGGRVYIQVRCWYRPEIKLSKFSINDEFGITYKEVPLGNIGDVFKEEEEILNSIRENFARLVEATEYYKPDQVIVRILDSEAEVDC